MEGVVRVDRHVLVKKVNKNEAKPTDKRSDRSNGLEVGRHRRVR
jgi:hypothetical protein